MAKALTARTVENLKPDPKKRMEWPDPALAGLYLVIQPSGVKSWALRYRYAGKPKKLTLGRWPAMTLAQARAAASEAIDAVEHGHDPSAAKKAAKATLAEAQLSERDRIKTLVAQFDRRHLSMLKSGRQARAFLDRSVVAAWGERDVQTITRRDVIDLLDEIVESGRATTANRVLAHARKFFNWCVERDILPVAPTMGVKSPTKEVSRDRVLTDQEVRWFWRACERIGQPWGPLGQLLLLTGQRLNEAAQMTEAELQGDIWHLQAGRTKNGRAHDVPISKAAQEVLAGVKRVAGEYGFIFTTTGVSPISGFSKARIALAAAMAEIAAEELGEPVEIPRWGFHDLRRTAATGMARLGIAVRVTEAVLNHVSGTGGGIVAIYQRHDYADEKKAALAAWANFLAALNGGGDQNVIPLVDRRL